MAELSDALIGVKLRAGDTVLMESRTGLLIEKLARPEVEELVLEEVPDVTYADVGGLDDQIEAITDAVELPVPLPGAVHRAQAARPQGHPALRPAGVREDPHRQGGGQLAGQEGGRGHRQHQRPQLLPQHQGPRAPQQVRGRDRAPDPPGLPAGPGEVRGGRPGHRLLRRDGLAVPDPGHRDQLGHGVDHRAAAAGRDRRRGDPEGRDRHRGVQPRGPHRPGHPAARPPRREDPHRAAQRGGGGPDLLPLPDPGPARSTPRRCGRSGAGTRPRPPRP